MPGRRAPERARALEQLRDLERQLQAQHGGRPAARARRSAARGAATRRRAASDCVRSRGARATGQASSDTLRRLAGEQDRARRAPAARPGRAQAAGSGSSPPGLASTERAIGPPTGAGTPDAANLQQAAADAAKDIERQRLAERMQQSADAMRKAAAGPVDSPPASQATSQRPAIVRGGVHSWHADAARRCPEPGGRAAGAGPRARSAGRSPAISSTRRRTTSRGG